MKKKVKRILCVIIIILTISVYAYYHRNAYVTQYTWKQTSDSGLIGGGVISFGENSEYTYQWPTIKKNGESVGVVILCICERMIVFSLEKKEIGFYMYI